MPRMTSMFSLICNTPFWNDTLSWNTNEPALSPCFTSTALVWLPSLFLLVCFPYTLYEYVNSKENVSIKWNRLNVSKLLIALSLVAISVAHVIYVRVNLFEDNLSIDKAQIIGTVVSLFAYCLMTALIHLQRVNGFTNCGFVWFYLILRIVCTALSIPTFIQFDDKSTTEQVLIYVEFGFEIILLFLCSVSDQIEILNGSLVEAKKGKITSSIICQKETASFPSKLTFWWFNSLAILGFRRPLTTDDLWQIREHDQATNLFDRFNHFWQHKSFGSNDKSATTDKTTLKQTKTNVVSILTRQFGVFFLFPCAARFITDNVQLVNPLVVKYVISFVSDPTAPFWHGIFFTMIFVVTNVVQSITSAYHQHRMGILGMRIRNCLLSAVYRKSLVLAMHSKKNYTTGEIINLMSVDCPRFMDLVSWFHFLWTAPVQIGIALVLLWLELGVSVVGGLILMLLFIPLQSYVGNLAKKIQEKQMALKDQRLKAINEMLNGIKVLKLYAWEEAFIANIESIRAQELKYIRMSGYSYTIFHIITYGSPFMVTCLTFALYILFDPNNQLTAQKAFVSVALFNMLRIPLARIPNAITGLIMTSIAVKRINGFLNSDEIIPYIDRKVDNANSIVMSNVSFNWDLVDETNLTTSITLSNINLTIPKGSLVAVVGSVGSGKSSLLYALLGEMHKLGGKLNISGDQRVAYVAQQAWIQNNTLKENILFGQSMQNKRYQQIVDVCALRTDFDMLPAGDETEIGEKGINLSGGQKQRVSIARACYSNADLYLFDDPLSAVDSHVGKHIFTQVLHSKSGILRNKTRILVTNALYMLPDVDQIVLLRNGSIDAVGHYDQLTRTNPYFHELILNYTNSSIDSEEDEEQLNSISKTSSNLQSNEIEVLKERGQSSISISTSRREKSFSISSEIEKSKSTLVEAEQSQTGQITFEVYKNFIKSISTFWFSCILSGHLLMIITITGSNIWLSVWTSDLNADSKYYLLIYFIIGATYLVWIVCSWISTVYGTMRASRTLHWNLLNSIVHAPMFFFDTTPLGRIINRFSKDIDVLDTYMAQNFRSLMNTTLTVLATMFIVSFETPLFLAIAIPFICMYLFLQRFYVSSSRQLKRLESVTRSPIFTHFSETINGVCTIKAFNASERFTLESDRRVDVNQRCMYPNVVSLCWLQVRLDFMANCLIFFASLFAVLSKGTSEDHNFDAAGSGTGLSLSYALSITSYLNMCVRWFAEFENNIVSVERIAEYTTVESEADWRTVEDTKVAPNWPQDGVVKFEQYGTRYRPGLDLVLKEINFSTGRGEKIGIVGRTGAGKSSLTLALFRIIEAANGKISIDGIDISRLGLQTLRSHITIIPQDPVLFCGTIRTNLDPFSTYSDDQLWSILELAHLKSFVSSLPLGMSYAISEGGENLSVGQRQLICLARALLRHTKVLVLDEATAAVDLETDSLIQSTIRHQFAHCTVLTIAHRLNTILDSDRVMVLDAGNVAEFDTPTKLLNDDMSIFYSLAKDAGIV